jgi:lincosamide nucleotidyltransferase A/C/D/E
MTARNAALVLELLERGEIPTWVAGGWGVDALVGRESRPHGDLDLLISNGASARARECLGDAGFVVSLDATPTRFEMRNPELGVVDLHPIRFDAGGHPWLELPNGASWVYGRGALDARGTIASRSCRCLSAQEQLRLHEGYELREVDHADIRLLRSLVGVQPSGDA